MARISVTFFGLLLLPNVCLADTAKPLLLQKPTVSRTHIAFVYGDDIWIVERSGGEARKLTTGAGLETNPVFSPDGSLLAFTGEYDGNQDVYVVPATGGVPRRLTYHPAPDAVVGWTPDGSQVLFRSSRNSYTRSTRLFTMPVAGGFPTEVPLPAAFEGSYSPDGKRLAYVPYPPAFQIWKRYRGGRASVIWLATLADSHIDRVPRDNSNDFNPMWLGNHVYFLSDRNGPFTLFAYAPATGELKQVVPNDGLDIKSASAGPDAIVYEQFGTIHLFDPKTETTRKLDIRVSGDLSAVRPRWVNAAKHIQSADLSPTGVRAVFEAHGEILTVPAEKGTIRNLTNSPGVADRYPAWSPDGKSIAYFSDESGEYELYVRDQQGHGEVKKLKPGNPPAYYYSPHWSPDSKKIAYTDQRLNLWYTDVDKGTSTLVDKDLYDDQIVDHDWSPDSRWLAYTRYLKNHLRAVFLYELAGGKHHQVTDGMSDSRHVLFDRNGKYLYFTASTDAGPTLGSEMSGLNRPISSSVYIVVLRRDLPSPLAHESDEEKETRPDKSGDTSGTTTDERDKAKKKKPVTVDIDLDGIDQRILALPIPAHYYTDLQVGKTGVLYLLENPDSTVDFTGLGESTNLTLHKFDLAKRKVEKLLEEIGSATVSYNGEKLLYSKGGNRGGIAGLLGPQGEGPSWFIVSADKAPKPGEGALKLDNMEVRVDPPAEWKQMYHEVWRMERDFLYDPGFHGLDLKSTEKKYEPYLERLASRRDLSYLFAEMLGELTLGHVYVFGGDTPEVKRVKGGLLGADYRIEAGRYRFARIYRGENWRPELRAPLTEPGVNVRVGDYLLGVGGRDLRASDNLYSFFEGTANKAVQLRVGPTADGKNARDVTVVPIENETALRNLSWIEENRRIVDRLSGGRLAYIYVPDTAGEGFSSFNRYFFAQVDKEGAIIDERFNSGGLVPDHVVDYLRRPLIGYLTTRFGKDRTTPMAGIFGPKAMLINEMAGSGGDLLPQYFRQAGAGPLIGKRTWGGLVGINGVLPLIDGGSVTAPAAAFWFPSGHWEVENHGVAPDIEVELDPQAVRAGHDPQLEKAVAVVLEALQKNPPRAPHKPAYPDYHKKGATTRR
jgi:tricorn protease